MNKDESSIKYATFAFMEKQRHMNANFSHFENIFKEKDIIKAYKEGWDSAFKNLWTDVNEKLPDDGVKVLVLTKNKKIVVSFRYKLKDISGNILDNNSQWNGSKSFGQNIIAWMPIPSFDEILESNKDVLQRLKYK